MAFSVNAQCQVDGLVDDSLVLANFDHNAVSVDDGIHLIQRAGLPLHYLLHDRMGHFGNQACRYIGIVKLFERGADFTGGHALGLEEEDCIIHACESSWLCFNERRLEGTVSITRNIYLNRAVVCINGFT